MTTTAQHPEFSRRLGARLRAARRARGWTLPMAASASHGAFGAAVLGAYERAERTITTPRLQALADLYQIDVSRLLPAGAKGAPRVPPEPPEPLTIDLAVVRQVAPGSPIARWCEMIVAERIGPAPGIVMLSRSDHAAVAAMLGTDLRGLRASLTEMQATFDRHYRRIG